MMIIMNDIKDILQRISGIFILLAALLYLFLPAVAPWILAPSVALFSVIMASRPYPGKSIRGKRLFNMQLFACMLMIVATYLMFRQKTEWVLAMICGSVFLFYAAMILPKELEKEKEQEK